ncbi:hypothetical protein EOM39_05900 [Candidatus Gracilibacteria bacterium]|nr:hypothetical protein [Candidatus Gracilibacteria bacterium]
MKDKKCDHTSFWQVYWIINLHNIFSDEKGREFKCKNCKKKFAISRKGYKKINKNLIKRYGSYFLWLSPALILIYLVAFGYMHYLIAILLIIAFHFGAMYYIINSPKLKIEEK